MADIQTVKNAKQKYEKLLFMFPNVVGVGVGYKIRDGKRTNDVCIVVNVAKKLDKEKLLASELIPKSIQFEGSDICTDIVETGSIKITSLTSRVRPLIPGYSIGHINITCGTLGSIVKDKDGKTFILSNNHVLANSGLGKIGDDIIQPGKHDGGDLHNDIVGHLDKFIEIRFINSYCPIANIVTKVFNNLSKLFGRSTQLISINAITNTVDCALSSMMCDYKKEIYNIGEPNGIVNGELGMKVRKSGRTTEYTEGEITQVDATVQISYGDQGTAVFSDQLIITCPDGKDFSAGGDSGSAIVNFDNKLVGLLFAGGEGHTIANRIQNVFDALKITL